MVSKIYTTPNFSLKPLELELAVVASKHPSADSSSGPSAIIVGSNADDTSPAVWVRNNRLGSDGEKNGAIQQIGHWQGFSSPKRNTPPPKKA
ncbi:hypothetical protein BELL_0297g00010 [Botrytis elliptica]|uniref:Uncharacterized protein n=1 Tax=Botrytis elliptica TaxID=278938 RepID=A0A4Z1JZ63_9HELO|nr:hypothetical protein BELL_0297g00010 [Botrytis elliptica]